VGKTYKDRRDYFPRRMKKIKKNKKQNLRDYKGISLADLDRQEDHEDQRQDT
jgi:hypothetical protein